MESLYIQQAQLKRVKQHEYDKINYAKNVEKKKTYYQEKKEERKDYQSKYDKHNKEQKRKYKKEHYKKNKEGKRIYYEENKEDRKNYQKKYDESHKERKKEYNKLKAHYKKYNEYRMERMFRVRDMHHLKLHVKGWCQLESIAHHYCWAKVELKCETCQEEMFKFKSSSEFTKKPYDVNALHCISCSSVVCNLCGKLVQNYQYYRHFYINGINCDIKESGKLCAYRTYLDVSDK